MIQCSQCKATKKESDFPKRKGCKDGRLSFCKDCFKIKYPKKSYEVLIEGVRKCSKCNIEKSVLEFTIRKENFGGRMTYCKECQYGHPLYKKPTVDKKCTQCKEVKLLSEFGFTNSKHTSHLSNCKKCLNKKKAVKRKETHYYKRRDLKDKYGMSIEEYNNLKLLQNNKCKICKNEDKLVVDHCHSSGKVRALLCENCNRGLGSFKDKASILKLAALYLQETNTNKDT